MKDPYDTLEVERDATDDVIRAAYRAKARKVHPDKVGGGTSAFQELNHAYAMLRDRRRRAQYDATGEDGPMTDAEAEARAVLASLVASLTDAIKNDSGDLLAMMRKSIIDRSAEINNRIRKTQEIADRARRLGNRFRRKNGDNLIRRILEDKARAHDVEIANMRTTVEVMENALRMLRDYTYDVPYDEPGIFSPMYRVGGGTSTTM